MQLEQILHVALEIPGPFGTQDALPPLVPHHIQYRAAPVLPPEHHVGRKLLVVEAAGAVGHRGIAVRLETVVVAIGAGRGGQLAHVRIAPLRAERAPVPPYPNLRSHRSVNTPALAP